MQLKNLSTHGAKEVPRKSLRDFVESLAFERFIVGLILLNSITLGLETVNGLEPSYARWLKILDSIFLTIFTIELALKAVVYKKKFFNDPWRFFDFIVVGVALLPASGVFSVVRALRVLRTLRMISVVPALRRVVSGLLSAVPGLASVGAIMLLIFYVASVMATKLFGNDFSEWFGNIGASAYSLFQIMTLESWSMGIVRPVMEKYPYAWLFFLPFILIATFTMLNLFIAVIVNAMQAETEQAAEDRAEQGHDERAFMLNEIKDLRNEIKKLTDALAR